MSHLLLVEDDNILASTVADFLRMEGYEIKIAKDGVEGLEMLNMERPDLLILDLILPKKSGEDVLEELRKQEGLKDLPVLVLTVKQDEQSMRRCLDLGIQGYLIKSDYSLKEIEKNIRQLLKK